MSDRGRPVTVEAFDRKYRRGGYAFLDRPGELGHYLIVAGYVHHLFRRPRVLDIGCGHGRLADFLREAPLRDYLGIDLSREAIRRARARHGARLTFAVADFNNWVPPGRYEAIIFSESLNYAAQPAATLERFATALAPGGALIVSLHRHRQPGARWWRTWRNAEQRFAVLDATTVTNRTGQTWDVKVLQGGARFA
jgi:trans-aconitate methyltransferase